MAVDYTPSIHGHIWPKDVTQAEIEMDFVMQSIYDMGEVDDYVQLVCPVNLPDHDGVEIRIPLKWLTAEAIALLSKA